MIMTLTGSTRRVLALIFLSVFIMIGVSAIVLPLWLRERQANSLMNVELSIEKIRARLMEQTIVLGELDERERVDRLEPHLLSAPTASLAAVELARRLSYLIDRAGGVVNSTEILDPVRTMSIWQVGVRLRATIDIVGLRELLYNIENNSLLLYVTQLLVQRFDKEQNYSKLQLEIVINGYARI